MFRLLPYLLFLGVLAACGGGNSTSQVNDDQGVDETPGAEKAELLISLTDAEGDFVSYEVDVNYLHFVRADGTEVSVLPQKVRMDFAEYIDLGEVLARASLPPGRYQSVALGLDYSEAAILVQSEAGETLPALAVDSEGVPLEEIEVGLQFGDSEGFVVLARQFLNLELDFDLDASHSIVIQSEQAIVEVNPVLLVDTQLAEPKTLRVRGLLTGVDESEFLFTVAVRPLRVFEGQFGELAVLANENTHFEIDGEIYAINEAFNVLQSMSASTPLVTFGSWDRSQQQFSAEVVLAGSSVAWSNHDVLRGVVLARTENTLTMRASLLQAGQSKAEFFDALDLQVSEFTRIFKWRAGEVDIHALSVGSTLRAIGAWDEESGVFNTENGLVRIGFSSLSGIVNTVSPLSVELHMLSAQRPQSFDFSGTGSSEETDADPLAYELATGNLALNNVQVGDIVRATGWIADFGAAPEDFLAQSLRDYSALPAHFVLAYPEAGVESGISAVTEEGFLFGLEESALKHVIRIAGIPLDLFELEMMPWLHITDERGVFALQLDNQITVSSDYTQFVSQLNEALDVGYRLQRVDAHGLWQNTLQSFESRRFRVRLVSPSMN